MDVGVRAHLCVLLGMLVKWLPSFYVVTRDRKNKSGRGNFEAVEMSSVVVFYLQICIKMVVRKLVVMQSVTLKSSLASCLGFRQDRACYDSCAYFLCFLFV